MLDNDCYLVYVLPLMASLIKKKKGNRLYYYLVESARVDGKPRIVHQAYLGTAEKVTELIEQKSAPVPLSATLRDFGLPGALWLAAKQSGVWPLLESLWPAPRSGPGPAHYLLLAALHRIGDPGPKTEVSNWYERTILASEWGFPAERFTSQAFWDAFEQILPESETVAPAEDPLDRAQLRLLGLWKEKQLVGRRLLAYDTTNFYTYIASTNTRNQLAQRGHNKQGRHNLRQVGLSYVLDGESGLSLCHHVYAGNVADVEEFSVALARIVRLLDQSQMARDAVTLVFDKGTAALDNTVQLQEAGVGWISALPWNQAPAELRERASEELPSCSAAQPGVRAVAEKLLVHGQEYLAVLKYSAPFAGEQQVERVFRGLKDGEWLAWGPMHHWTDRKIRIHAFYCMLGISLLQYVHRQAKAAWSDLSMEQLLEELQEIQQFVLLYPRQGEKGTPRAAYVLSSQTLAQQALAKALKLDELQITHRR